MSDQVDKTISEQQITCQGGRVVKDHRWHGQWRDPEFDPWSMQFLKIWIFEFPW